MPSRLSKALAVLVLALLCSEGALAQAVVLGESEQQTERKALKKSGNAPSRSAWRSAPASSRTATFRLATWNKAPARTIRPRCSMRTWTTRLGEKTDLQLGYGLSQTSYDDFPEFDLQNHLLTGEVSRDFGTVDAGMAYRYIHTRLGGHDYMTTQQASPSVSRFFGRKLFARAEYTFSDKDFDEINERDATAHAGGADLYWFLNGVRRYVVFGYRYREENADDAQFDYGSHNLKLRLSQRFRFMARDATLKLGWLYEQRDYSAATPAIGENRDDDRNRFQAELELPLGDRLFTVLEYEYGGSRRTSSRPTTTSTSRPSGWG